MAKVTCTKCPTKITVPDDEADKPRLCGRCWIAERAAKNGTPPPPAVEPVVQSPAPLPELEACSGGRYVHGVYGLVFTRSRSRAGQPLCETCGGK